MFKNVKLLSAIALSVTILYGCNSAYVSPGPHTTTEKDGVIKITFAQKAKNEKAAGDKRKGVVCWINPTQNLMKIHPDGSTSNKDYIYHPGEEELYALGTEVEFIETNSNVIYEMWVAGSSVTFLGVGIAPPLNELSWDVADQNDILYYELHDFNNPGEAILTETAVEGQTSYTVTASLTSGVLYNLEAVGGDGERHVSPPFGF